MNKRQAKKQFKKKYGMNPKDYYLICNFEAIAENVRKLFDDIVEIMPDILSQMCESINYIIEDVDKFVQSDEFKKIIQATKELSNEGKLNEMVQDQQIQEHEDDC